MGLFSKKEKVVAEGFIQKYSIMYLGGHPDYPKSKIGEIILNLFEDRFELQSTIGSQKWFKGLTIPYDKISDLQIVQRQVSSVEGLLGGLDSRQLNQANNIHITYKDDNDKEILLRLEMITGVTVMGQAKKCMEFQDLLRINNIYDQFSKKDISNLTQDTDDIPAQIKKLSDLKNLGILTEEEFETKKKELLSKM